MPDCCTAMAPICVSELISFNSKTRSGWAAGTLTVDGQLMPVFSLVVRVKRHPLERASLSAFAVWGSFLLRSRRFSPFLQSPTSSHWNVRFCCLLNAIERTGKRLKGAASAPSQKSSATSVQLRRTGRVFREIFVMQLIVGETAENCQNVNRDSS